jgi:2-oxoglutarate dehydrogenase complex dehydrogenase (E1) component-like enzyme
VNGDDVDAVTAVFKLAVDWRMEFKVKRNGTNWSEV